MMINVLLWYLIIGLVGWLVFPLAFRLFAFLPDRGLAFSRPLGLLLSSYLYWLLVSLHVLQNDMGGVFFALLALAAISAWLLWRGKPDEDWAALRDWLRVHLRLVLTTELVFLLAFAVWTVVRAANPDASGTEKPMELAFINAILRSPAFPPSDPWLSGYAISYYYFGYIMVAMLARLTGTPGAVAFNLGLSSWFALTALAAYGLLYNLLALRDFRAAVSQTAAQTSARAWALLAPLFVLLVSNLEGFLEMLHARGLFWSGIEEGAGQSRFWSWLNIQELTQPPAPPLSWEPERVTGIWWWRASRVLQDFDVNGGSREIIDEFPAFSYLLGDLHPHVLAMPFALLAMVLALNAYLKVRALGPDGLRMEKWISRAEFWLAALGMGALAFLNTWDFPIYLALFAAAVTLARYLREGFRWGLVFDFVFLAVSLGVAGILLYLPFYLGFASQANGLLPSLVFFTRGVYFWMMFASLLLPVLGWLVWSWRRRGALAAFLHGALFAAGITAGLWVVSSLFGLVLLSADPGLAGIYGASDASSLLPVSLARRLESPGTWLSLFFLLALTWGLFRRFRCPEVESVEDSQQTGAPVREDSQAVPAPFVLLLVLLGCGLVLFPEFFYLRDQFGWRMNTIFKFYFQAWMVWAIAAGYASAVLWQEMRRSAGWLAFGLGWVVLIAVSLAYPLFGLGARTGNFSPQEWTLDGAAYIARYNPEEMEAIRWLRDAPYGVVAEAVGGSYSGFARVSTLSGQPSVLGWPGHESQWRGGAREIGSREPDLAMMFRARQWEQIRPVLEKYNIRYIFIGSLEQNTYRPDEDLFQRYLTPVFHNASVTIYEFSQVPSLLEQAAQP